MLILSKGASKSPENVFSQTREEETRFIYLGSFQTLFNKLHPLLDLIPNRFTSKSQSENWNLNSDA